MKRIALNVQVLQVTAVIISAIFFAISFLLDDWTWFQRGGGVVTMIGGALASRRVIRIGVDELFRSETIISGGCYGLTPEQQAIQDEALHQQREDIRAIKASFFVLLGGTVVWTFGDLVGPIAAHIGKIGTLFCR